MITQHKERLLLLFQSIVFPKVFLFCSFCHTAQWYNLSFNSVKYWCCHRSKKKKKNRTVRQFKFHSLVKKVLWLV